MPARTINSVGIDVGTTTTQVIFSQLELVNAAGPSEVPRYGFARRDVTYLSPVVFTPVDFEGAIRGEELLAFILSQYRAAGLRPEQVESGAIIVTGETSKAANARQTVLDLAEELGDFVVATAGPHLESVIAGHGSGAAEYSRRHGARVLNIDIGGGTSNFARFAAGQLLDTACLNVGGHLVQCDAQGRLVHLHEPARRVLEDLYASAPEVPDASQIGAITERMAELVVEVIRGEPSALCRRLLMTPALGPQPGQDVIFLSGGVGECFYRDSGDPARFGDIGPQLAAALRRQPALSCPPVREPAQTLRATVIGAGAHTLALSGSTIWLNFAALPLRNLPVLHCSDPAPHDAAALAAAWHAHARLQDLCAAHDRYALAIPPGLPVNYRSVQLCALALQRFVALAGKSPGPLIVVACQDIGKALGMELQPLLPDQDLAVIDEVQIREWDYIDIGKGLFGDSVVPVTVKSLAFPNQDTCA